MTGSSRKAALMVSGLNLAGKLLGLGKTLLIAGLFGTTGMLDAFWVAYSLPLLLPALLTGTLTIAFVPRFVSSLEGRTGAEAWRGANTLFTLVIGFAIIGSVLMYIFASGLVQRLAPGLDLATHVKAVELTRLLLPAVVIITISSLLSALSYARERFVLPGLESIVNNIAIITLAVFCAKQYGVTALLWGVMIGYAMQAVILIVGNRDLITDSIRPALAFKHPDFLAPFGHLLPLFVGSAGSMLVGLVDQYFVSLLDAGSISALTYAGMLAFLPIEVFAQAVLTTYYPSLGRSFGAGDYAAAAATYAEGARFLLLLTLPCAILLAVLAEPIVVLLLQRGKFDATSTALTVQAMMFLSLVVVARAHAYFSYRVLHAARWAWTQVGIGLLGVVTAIVLNMMWARTLGLRGIALATLVSAIQSALLATFAVRRLLDAPWPRGFGRDLVNVIVPCLALTAIIVPARWLIGPSSGHPLQAFLTCAIAAPAGLFGLWVAVKLGQPDVVAALTALRRRLRKYTGAQS
ncbi:MAG: lipid II flippase MurJ [Dokdonella sp.]